MSIKNWISVLPANWIAIDVSIAPDDRPPGESVLS